MARCSRSARSAPADAVCGRIDFVEANAEELPLESKTFDAYTIAFGIRNVPRIDAALREAYRVLKPGGRFLCLEFSKVDVPLLDRIYDAYSFNVIPKLGQMVTGDAESYQYLVESIRRFPHACRFRADDRGGGLPAGHAPPADRPASSPFIPAGRSDVIGSLVHLARNARAPASSWPARAPSRSIDPSALPPAARLGLRLARIIERPQRRRRRGAALGGPDAAWVRPT